MAILRRTGDLEGAEREPFGFQLVNGVLDAVHDDSLTDLFDTVTVRHRQQGLKCERQSPISCTVTIPTFCTCYC